MIAPTPRSLLRARVARDAAAEVTRRTGHRVEPEDLLPEDDVPSLEHLRQMERYDEEPENRRH